ncbi:hypothetical protein F5884DRAFT_311366 [Xylogone sp. PMI_703]|nr:hypothetical protein F5884DRAFT_311366 [Xylogone sp. PMI_703]
MSILQPADGNDADYATVNVSNDGRTNMTDPQGLSGEGGDSKQQDGNESTARDARAKKLCGVCNANEAKYKCTRCLLPYCSLSCSTAHKASHPATEPPAATAPPNEQLLSPQSEKRKNVEQLLPPARPRGPFAALEDSQELQELFRIYPNLPSQLEAIYSATLPPTSSSSDGGNNNHSNNNNNLNATTQSNFRNWAANGAGGNKRSGRGGKNQPWNQDIGLQCGVQALCRAREVFGKDGEAVREYSKLVLKLLSDEEGVDVAEQIQKELAEENARIISQLLNGEM